VVSLLHRVKNQKLSKLRIHSRGARENWYLRANLMMWALLSTEWLISAVSMRLRIVLTCRRLRRWRFANYMDAIGINYYRCISRTRWKKNNWTGIPTLVHVCWSPTAVTCTVTACFIPSPCWFDSTTCIWLRSINLKPDAHYGGLVLGLLLFPTILSHIASAA